MSARNQMTPLSNLSLVWTKRGDKLRERTLVLMLKSASQAPGSKSIRLRSIGLKTILMLGNRKLAVVEKCSMNSSVEHLFMTRLTCRTTMMTSTGSTRI